MRMQWRKIGRSDVPLPILSTLVVGAVLLAGCTASNNPRSEANPIEKAAVEATAMIESAQATAMVLQAQGTAAALVQGARSPERSPGPPSEGEVPRVAQGGTPMPLLVATVSRKAAPSPTPMERPGATETAAPVAVELLRVEIGRESGLISVQFKAPPRVAQKWWQGSVSVTDEATGAVYNEIPVLPIVGPLISRPVRAGQLGYVMLANAPTPLKAGAVVTVVLGDYVFEHQTVQG